MAISDKQVASLRAFLAHEPSEFVHLTRPLMESTDAEGYGELVYAAFALTVRRRFSPSWTIPDVVRVVATIRARLLETEVDVDPRAAETLIRRVLGDSVAGDFDDEAKSRAQIFVLAELVDDEELDDAALDAFLVEARALADQLS